MSLLNSRGLAIAILAITTVVVSAQDQPKITLSRSTTNTSEILAEITKQAGISVTATSTLRDFPLLINVTDVPLDELLEKIAKVTGGKISKEDYGLLLIEDRQGRRAQANKEKKWTEDAFERAKGKLVARNKAPARWTTTAVDKIIADDRKRRDDIAEQIGDLSAGSGNMVQIFDSRMGSSTPARGSAYQVVDQIPARVLASVGPGDRVVYASRPTRMQTRMPFSFDRIQRDFVFNHNLLASRTPNAPAASGVEIVGSVGNKTPIQGVSKMYVILTRGQQTQAVQVEVKFADVNGIFVGESSLGVVPDYGTLSESKSEEGEEIKLSQLSRELALIMAQETNSPSSDRQVFQVATSSGSGAVEIVSAGSNSQPKQVPANLMRALINPLENEPTGFYIAESFLQTSKATNKNIVATFHDGLIPALAQKLVKGKLTSEGLIVAGNELGLEIEQDENWMTVKPIWSISSENTRFDRKEASIFFGRANARGYVSLDEMAEYSKSIVTGTPRKSLDLIYLALINKDVADQFGVYVTSNLDMLRLYGSLPANMKRSTGDEIIIPTNRLAGLTKNLATRIAYKPVGGNFFMGGMGEERMAIISMSVEGDGPGAPPMPANSVLKEPTESMPNGLPSGSSLVFSRQVGDAVFGSITGLRGGKFMSAAQLGMQQGMHASQFGSEFMSGQNYDRFKLGQMANISLAIDLGDIGRPSARFQDSWLLNGSRDLTFGQLPKSFRVAVDAAKQQMANAGQMDIGGRRRTPPPTK